MLKLSKNFIHVGYPVLTPTGETLKVGVAPCLQCAGNQTEMTWLLSENQQHFFYTTAVTAAGITNRVAAGGDIISPFKTRKPLTSRPTKFSGSVAVATDGNAIGINRPQPSLYESHAVKRLSLRVMVRCSQFLGGLLDAGGQLYPLKTRILAAAGFVTFKVNDKNNPLSEKRQRLLRVTGQPRYLQFCNFLLHKDKK
jgi:hypothetical protein